MTRKSRREIESAVEDMDSDGDTLTLSGGWDFIDDEEEAPDRELDLVTADGWTVYTGVDT